VINRESILPIGESSPSVGMELASDGSLKLSSNKMDQCGFLPLMLCHPSELQLQNASGPAGKLGL
jgi:hypothetical protein